MINSKIPVGIIKLAYNKAKESSHKFKVGAVIFKGKKIISAGKNNPEKFTLIKDNRYFKWPYSVHAELDVIGKLIRPKKLEQLKKASILVIRINNKGNFRLAKPCKYCQYMLTYFGVSEIYYSISEYPYIVKL